jgi:hypothetical protein
MQEWTDRGRWRLFCKSQHTEEEDDEEEEEKEEGLSVTIKMLGLTVFGTILKSFS